MKSSGMVLLHLYPYVLVASVVIIVIHISVSLDHLHIPQLRTSTRSRPTEHPWANLTRINVKATNVGTGVVQSLTNPSKELINGDVTKKISWQLSPEIKETRTIPVYPKANISSCDKDIKFMPSGSMPLVALVSAPGSGNTWLRYLIEKMTGIYTGSIYNDKSLRKGGFLGETEPPRSGRVVVVKMHNIQRWVNELDGIILLVRNPYNAIVADFNRIVTYGNHQGTAPIVAFKSTYWPHFAKCSAQRWQRIAFSCIETHVRTLVVYYEDLQVDLPQQLRRIVSFLGLPVDGNNIKCALQDSEGNFHRLNHSNFDPFAESLKAAVDRTIGELRKVFHFYKYKSEPLKAYERSITTSLASYNSMFFGMECNRILPPL